MGSVTRLLADFAPGVLAVEKAFISRNRDAALLNALVGEVQTISKRKGLQVVVLAPGTVRKELCGNGWVTKEDVGKFIASQFPDLKAYLGQNRKWKDGFHANMFDAVALGLAANARCSAQTRARYGTWGCSCRITVVV